MSEILTAPGSALTDYLYRKATRLRLPISGTFELSPVCNFRCRMCYVRRTAEEVARSERGILTLEDWRAIARQAWEAGTLDILLTGGEPLLWPDFWTLYDELTAMGFQVSINTNGSLIDERAVAHFLKKPPHRINITLYGAGDESYRRLCGAGGAFSKVDRAIRALTQAGITVKLNCSLTPENAADLEWIIAYARERQVLVTVATYMFPPIRRDETMIGVNERFTPEEAARYQLRTVLLQQGPERYRAHLRGILNGTIEPPGLDESCVDPVDGKIRCRAGKASFWITWDGFLTGCGMMPQPQVDLKQTSFREGWDELVRQTEAIRLSGVCGSCPNQELCHPCAAIAWAETGSFGGIPSYMCRAAQEMRRIARETLGSGETQKETASADADAP